jgi:hypothetical protein
MIPLSNLWLPILLSAVGVFIVSSLVHMAFKYHQSDYRRLPREKETLDLLRGDSLGPGNYVFPFCTHGSGMKSPEMQEKFRLGPVGMMTIRPSGTVAMGKFLGLWFAYCLLVAVFIAYLASRTLAPGIVYLTVFRFVGTVAFMAYGLNSLADSIWKGQPWSVTAKNVFDGLLYALVTAGVFGWLWPR